MPKMTLEKLAIMVKSGFDHVNSQLSSVHTKLDSLEHGQSALERGQEDMLLKVDNYAYKFEVVELKKRVTKTEGRLNTLEEAKK